MVKLFTEMELNEIVNPYFSFPVVGVVICAVLVYAFGFKPSAQPPSFDFEGDRKNYSKKRKVNKKPLTNGNVHVVVSSSSAVKPVTKIDAKTPKQSSPKLRPANNVQANNPVSATSKTESETKVGLPRIKAPVEKKGEKVKKEKNVVKSGEEELKKVVEKKTGEGEWVQLLSRKEKKNRKKEEIIDEIKESFYKEEKRSHSITPSNSKENSPAKTKAAVKTGDKAKVIKVKQDNNSEKKAESPKKSVAKPLAVLNDNIKPVENEVKPAKNTNKSAKIEVKPADAIITNESLPLKQKKKNGKIAGDVPAKENVVINNNNAPIKAVKLEPVAAKVVVENKQEPEKAVEIPAGKIAFDELGDPWEETKSQKKKKKTRRDQ